MARSEGNIGGANQLPTSEAAVITFTSTKRQIPRRKKTLIAITVCLNVLLWSSVSALICTFYLLAADTNDVTNLPSEIFTITSCLVSIAYIVLHSVVARRQTKWPEARLEITALSKTCYLAIRLAITLCVLWLLTSGWNLIIAARQPVCVSSDPRLAGWEAGPTCVAGRITVAMTLFALIGSCALFGILAIVRRPFEANLFRHMDARLGVHPTSPKSSNHSLRSVSSSSRFSHFHLSLYTTSLSHRSDIDMDTIDLEAASPQSPDSLTPVLSPVRSIGLGIFTSQSQPPSLPPEVLPMRSISLNGLLPPTFPPSQAMSLVRPPAMHYPSANSRNSSLPNLGASGSIPLPIPPAITDSAWRAVHPSLDLASHHFSHLPLPNLHSANSSHIKTHSRSVVSLSRPKRLSSTPISSVALSSRSSRSGHSGDGSGSSIGSEESGNLGAKEIRRSSAPEIRRPSAPAVDLFRPTLHPTAVLLPPSTSRRNKAWQPRLEDQDEGLEGLPVELLVTSPPDSESRVVNKEQMLGDRRILGCEDEINQRLGLGCELKVRKTRGMSPLRGGDRSAQLERAALVRLGGDDAVGLVMLEDNRKAGA